LKASTFVQEHRFAAYWINGEKKGGGERKMQIYVTITPSVKREKALLRQTVK
jgi:hypothetical protein